MDPDELLWELSTAETRRAAGTLSDDILRAYREGALAPDTAGEVEAILTDSPAARAQLAALAGVRLDPPPADVRRRLLGDAPRDSNGAAAGPVRRPASRAAIWRVAAALLGVAIVAPLVVQTYFASDTNPAPWTGAPAFDVTIEGLARERSAPGRAEAYPDTRVMITVQAQEAARDNLEYGVFREVDGRARRLREGVAVETFRGAAQLSAKARDLVGSQAGQHRLFIVVARRGAMPANPQPQSGESVRDSLSTEYTRVYEQVLELLPAQ